MKIPNIVNNETTYYTITLFKYRNYYGRTLSAVYPNVKTAIDIFVKIIKSGIYHSVILREETVYKRNEKTELSTSKPISKYENNYDFSDFILEMEGK